MTDAEFDKLDDELRAVAYLLLLRRPAVRRWAAREFGVPEHGPLSTRFLAAWCGVDEKTFYLWERAALMSLKGRARRAGLTPDAVAELRAKN